MVDKKYPKCNIGEDCKNYQWVTGMKFKSEKEVIKECYARETDLDFNDGVGVGVRRAFQSFAERIEFYRKYANNKMLFEKDHRELWYEYEFKSIGFSRFDLWLFDYCFGGI